MYFYVAIKITVHNKYKNKIIKKSFIIIIKKIVETTFRPIR